MPKRFLGPLCLFILAGILTLGLWPFHSPANDVTWIEGLHGLSFRGEGTLFSAPSLGVAGAGNSIEIWASATSIGDGATLLTFHNPASSACSQVGLQRSWSDLKIQSRQEKSYFQIVKRTLYVDEAFQPGKLVFLTLTSGKHGTRVYANGRLLRAFDRDLILDCAFQGRLILGDADGQSDGWSGRILGLANYRQELTEEQVRRHFETWTKGGRPAIENEEGNQSLYLFDEGRGRVVHDQGPAGLHLEMPERYGVVDKKTLTGFWDEFTSTPGYWLDVANNIVGFVPVGFCFFAYWANASSLPRPGLLAVLSGLALSLTIECTQPFLATRESGTTDLLTNTVGTLLGAGLYSRIASWWVRRFSRSLFY